MEILLLFALIGYHGDLCVYWIVNYMNFLKKLLYFCQLLFKESDTKAEMPILLMKTFTVDFLDKIIDRLVMW